MINICLIQKGIVSFVELESKYQMWVELKRWKVVGLNMVQIWDNNWRLGLIS